MQKKLKFQLSVFMFLQYFIWGSWYVPMGAYLANTLKFEGGQVGLEYGYFTVGWIAGGLAVSALHAEQTSVQFYLAGAVSIAFGLYSFTLPHTPPKKVGQDVSIGEVLGLDALALMKKPSFAIFVVCIFLICIP